MRNYPSIVWFEAGRPVPRYAMNNFELTRKLHKNLDQYLITDSDRNFSGIRTIHLNKLPKSPETLEFEGISKEWSHGQKYFWHNTTARFFYIYDFILTGYVSEVLHLESDSVLLSSEILSFFENHSHINFAYPMQANDIGCGSIMFIRQIETYKKFLRFILQNWNRKNVDDMQLLGSFAKLQNLKNLSTKLDLKDESQSLIFDAGSIGVYFVGLDARNNRFPLSTRGHLDFRKGSISDLIESRKLKFKIPIFGKGLRVTLVGGNIELANIHIHSKNISSSIIQMKLLFKFSFEWKIPILWRMGRLDKIVLAERLLSFINRRILRSSKKEDRILR